MPRLNEPSTHVGAALLGLAGVQAAATPLPTSAQPADWLPLLLQLVQAALGLYELFRHEHRRPD